MSAYKQQKHTKQMNENGLTLVEVLASVVLLTIIITIFLNVFIQSAKTNTTSEEVVDATYLAQTEMERIYSKSLTSEHSKPENGIRELDYNLLSSERQLLFIGKILDEGYYAKVKMQKDSKEETENMHRFIVTIHHGSMEGKTQAQMENILVWEREAD